jgi:hypothetical protein
VGGARLLLQILDEGRHVKGPDLRELLDAVLLAPLREALGRDEVGAAGVVVVDLSGKEFEHSLGRRPL